MLGADSSVSATAGVHSGDGLTFPQVCLPWELRVLESSGTVETLSEDWTHCRRRKSALWQTSSWLFTESAGYSQGCVRPI